MSDDPASFAANVDKMFAEFVADIDSVARRWMNEVSYEMVFQTRGPGFQLPEDTEYVATGRLRAGYRVTIEQGPSDASRWSDGPYDDTDDGSETAQRLKDEIASLTDTIPSELNIWTDVAYGYLVHEGLGHLIPSPWMDYVTAQAPGIMLRVQEG